MTCGSGLEALVTYVRAAAEHGGETVAAICGRIVSRHDVGPRGHDLTSTPRSLIRGRTEHAAGTWITHGEPAIWPGSTRRAGRSRVGVMRSATATE
jgi:hypothetical protein